MSTVHISPGRSAREGRPYGLEFVATGYGYPSLTLSHDEFWARTQYEFGGDRDALAADTKLAFRRWCGPGETTWTMARDAITKALRQAPEVREQIDVVLVASGTSLAVLHPPDPENPGLVDIAPLALQHIDRPGALGMDLKACYCAGFIRCLEVADALLANPNYRAALLVATEWGSRTATAASNRSSFVFLAADAAGAAIVRKTEVRRGLSGLIDYVNFTEADKRDWIGVAADGMSMLMKGSRAGEAVESALIRSGRILLERNGLRPSDVTWLLPIQSYAPLIERTASALEWPAEKVLWFGEGGFSGSASIPSCLAEQIERGRVQKGDSILAVAVGAGLSAGAALFTV